jgi:hypothetical protein
MKADMEIIKKITGTKRNEKSAKKHQKAQRNFMRNASDGMSAMVAVLAEQSNTQLLNSMTPRTRNEMAKKMFKLKMKKLMYESNIPASRLQEQSLLSSSDDEQEEEEEEEAGQRCSMRRDEDAQENEEEEENGLVVETDEDDEEVANYSDDSPGDNRVCSPGGTSRLPKEIAQRYKNLKNRKSVDIVDDSDDDDSE